MDNMAHDCATEYRASLPRGVGLCPTRREGWSPNLGPSLRPSSFKNKKSLLSEAHLILNPSRPQSTHREILSAPRKHFILKSYN
jgi:hypothetical protein